MHYLLGFFPHTKAHPFLAHFESFCSPLKEMQLSYAPEKSLLSSTLCAKDYFTLTKKCSDTEIQTYLAPYHLDVNPTLPIKKYSKGMQQRLQLALAFFSSPEIVFLDEPTSGLDPFGTDDIEALLKIKSQTTTLILSTHSLKFAYELGNEIWIMKEGRRVYTGVPESYEALLALFNATRPQEIR
jgi:ABC-2 type transport system ATP-binding protein